MTANGVPDWEPRVLPDGLGHQRATRDGLAAESAPAARKDDPCGGANGVEGCQAVSDNQQGDGKEATTLLPWQGREVAAAFEKTRQAQKSEAEMLNRTSMVPSHELEDWRRYYMQGWTPDRGSNMQAKERVRERRPALVETGHASGTSRVDYSSTRMLAWHMWHRDFFLTLVHQNMLRLVTIIVIAHLASFFFFSGIWYAIWRCEVHCLKGISGYVQVFIFSMITQQTIGYGNSSPNNCAWAALVITVQTLFGLVLNAISIGVLFARISHPQQRARSIFISENAVITRRDGILKLMFRIADIKTTQVIDAKVRAYMYSWGEGRHTVEGEFIPVRTEDLDLSNIDGLLLLPITIEHTIDERSPLCGHTYDSLKALNAEIIVTFEGSTEMGNPFMSRQSYLAEEIRWGYQFARCIHRPRGSDTQYTVDIAKFHEVEPQPDMRYNNQRDMSRAVVSRSKRTVPYPLLGENTLVLSESMCLTEIKGELCLMFRIGDTYPNQILDPIVRAYVYRWPDNPTAKQQDYTVTQLEVGYDTGRDRLLLWLPMVVVHHISETSPLASWSHLSGFLADANSAIAVIVEGYMYSCSENRMRMRIYHCSQDIRVHHRFANMVVAPKRAPDGKAQVDWTRFHTTVPVSPPQLHEEPSDKGPKGKLLGRLSMYRSGTRSSARSSPSVSRHLSAALDSPTGVSRNSPLSRESPMSQDAPGTQDTTRELHSDEYETSPMVYEGANLSSLLPHLDPQSTFNRRDGQTLAQPGWQQNTPADMGSTALLSRMRSKRAGLPALWRHGSSGSTHHSESPGTALPASRVSLVPEEDAQTT